MTKRAATVIMTCLLVLAGMAYAVTPGGQQDAIVERIAQACASMKTMSCDFRQIRTVPLMDEPQVSSGSMHYRQPSSLKWVYYEPVSYTFNIDGDRISLDTPDGHSDLDGDAGRMFKGLAGIVLGCMSGKNLTDKRLFQTTATEKDGEWVAVLIPQRREMKRVFSEIVMVFDPVTALLKRMTMKDQTGGSTEIEISNATVNADEAHR